MWAEEDVFWFYGAIWGLFFLAVISLSEIGFSDSCGCCRQTQTGRRGCRSWPASVRWWSVNPTERHLDGHLVFNEARQEEQNGTLVLWRWLRNLLVASFLTQVLLWKNVFGKPRCVSIEMRQHNWGLMWNHWLVEHAALITNITLTALDPTWKMKYNRDFEEGWVGGGGGGQIIMRKSIFHKFSERLKAREVIEDNYWSTGIKNGGIWMS